MRPLDWVKNLPGHWEAKPLRSISRYSASNVDKLSSDNEIRIRLCNYTDVYHNEFITNGLGFMSATATSDEVEKFGLAVGDVIITKDSEAWDDIGVPALVREAANDLVCGYHLALLRAHKKVMDGPFLFRCLQAKPVQLQFVLAARGVTRFGLSRTEIGATILPVPSLPQQRAIADYLDRETARIDSLVEAKERLLYLLTEKRQALLAHAVAGSIDADALTRDSRAYTEGGNDETAAAESGISRRTPITAFPTKRLKYLVTVRRSPSTENDAALSYIGLENIEPRTGRLAREIKGNDTMNFSMDNGNRSSGIYFECGDVLFGKLRPYLAKAWIAEFPGRCTTEVFVMTPHAIDPRFLRSVLLSSTFIDSVDASTFGSKMPRAEWSFVGNLPVPAPDRERSRAIADRLDRETARLDELAARTHDTVVLLKERRGALIAAAVTGQIDVGNAA